MRYMTALMAVALTAACAEPAEEPIQRAETSVNWLEGIYEYVPPLRGQSIAGEGRFVFLYGPADGSGPMTGDAGTYQISGDTVTNTVVYSTIPVEIGLVYRWTPEATSGDTLTYAVMNEAGEVTSRGRSIKVR
jgi:hypothetical protein